MFWSGQTETIGPLFFQLVIGRRGAPFYFPHQPSAVETEPSERFSSGCSQDAEMVWKYLLMCIIRSAAFSCSGKYSKHHDREDRVLKKLKNLQINRRMERDSSSSVSLQQMINLELRNVCLVFGPQVITPDPAPSPEPL